MRADIALSLGFAPIARSDARILILGSLPGQRSLAAGEYYAHPQNKFWTIMAELAGASGRYEQRCAALLESRIALWDVLESSQRPGSLDADIRMSSAAVNDFTEFLAQHRAIEKILFNGQKAAQIFVRRVLPGLGHRDIALRTMPSTSPAHAAMSYRDKMLAWRAALV